MKRKKRTRPPKLHKSLSAPIQNRIGALLFAKNVEPCGKTALCQARAPPSLLSFGNTKERSKVAMLIEYKFLKGRAVEVEVSEEIGAVILQTRDDTYNSNRRETRRHESLSDWNDKERRAADSSADVVTDVLRRIEAEALHSAIAKLKPDEQDLIHRLYLDKPPMTQAEYARQVGTTENYINTKAQRIKNKLKRLI